MITDGNGSNIGTSWCCDASWAVDGPSDLNIPMYYGNSNDPVYKILSVTNDGTGAYRAAGTLWHIQSPPACSKSSDKNLSVWDQTRSTGNLLTIYCSNNSVLNPLNACPGKDSSGVFHNGTVSDPCPLSDNNGSTTWGWAQVNSFSGATESNGICGGGNPPSSTCKAWSSIDDLPAWAGFTRINELMQGHFYHMLYLDTDCTVSPAVFPAVGFGTALLCSSTTNVPSTNRPHNGSVFFLDYTATQLADIYAKMTATQRSVQYPYIEAMTYYGGMIGDTGGSGTTLTFVRAEDQVAYKTAGVTDPIFAWLGKLVDNTILTEASTGTNNDRYRIAVWENVPIEGGTDITRHIHIVDPCVIQTMAGVPGGCAIPPTPPAKPQGLKFN